MLRSGVWLLPCGCKVVPGSALKKFHHKHFLLGEQKMFVMKFFESASGESLRECWFVLGLRQFKRIAIISGQEVFRRVRTTPPETLHHLFFVCSPLKADFADVVVTDDQFARFPLAEPSLVAKDGFC